MENPPFWWYLQGNMGIFMGYVSFREGKSHTCRYAIQTMITELFASRLRVQKNSFPHTSGLLWPPNDPEISRCGFSEWPTNMSVLFSCHTNIKMIKIFTAQRFTIWGSSFLRPGENRNPKVFFCVQKDASEAGRRFAFLKYLPLIVHLQLGGGFKHFFFSPLFGEDSHFD